MAINKFSFPTTIYFLYLLFSSITTNGQSYHHFNFEKFGNELEKKSLEEVTQHLKSNLDSFCLLECKSNSLGKYCGYELLSKRNTGEGILTYSLQLKYEQQIFFITLLFNESIEKWTVSELKQVEE